MRRLEVDRIKRPIAIRSLVEIEATTNYSPPAITSAVKEYAALSFGECARELKRKEVANIKYKIRGPMETHLIGNSVLELDILESVSYLTEHGYFVENYRVSQWSTKGAVFVYPDQLKELERHMRVNDVVLTLLFVSKRDKSIQHIILWDWESNNNG